MQQQRAAQDAAEEERRRHMGMGLYPQAEAGTHPAPQQQPAPSGVPTTIINTFPVRSFVPRNPEISSG